MKTELLFLVEISNNAYFSVNFFMILLEFNLVIDLHCFLWILSQYWIDSGDVGVIELNVAEAVWADNL